MNLAIKKRYVKGEGDKEIRVVKRKKSHADKSLDTC